MEEIHDSVPDHLKCPICFEIPLGEVFQCRNGHRFCKSCYEKLDRRCPHCRVYFPRYPIRCRAVEEMLDSLKLEYPCQFQIAGCEKKLERKDIGKHSKFCKFDFQKFGELQNVCELFGFKNCSFKFNRGDSSEALLHFELVHGMRSIKSLLLNTFGLVYEDFEEIYKSPEAAVFAPLIFDQKWWGHNCIYIIVTRFNPLQKTLEFTPFHLVPGWDGINPPKNWLPEPVEFSQGNSCGTVRPQHLLNYEDGQTLNDSSHFAIPLKKLFKGDNKPERVFVALQIKLSENKNLQPPPDNKNVDLERYTTYRPCDVFTASLLNERWPTLIRQVCSGSASQNWDQFRWIAYQDYKKDQHRFSPASTSFIKKKVLICRANINDTWVVGFLHIETETGPASFFKFPNLLKPKRVFYLDDNFEVLYTPPDSFEWAAWKDLNNTEPIPVHEEEKDLLICESRSPSGHKDLGAGKKDMEPGNDDNIHVFVLSKKGKEIAKRDTQGNMII